MTKESSPKAFSGALSSSALTTKNDTNESDSESTLALRPSGPVHTFATPENLLDFVTKRWRSRFVTTDIPTEAVLDVFIRRPFFLLLSVDAPLTVRWRRFQRRAKQPGDEEISLEDFVTHSDSHLYDPKDGLQPLISRASVRLLNTSSSLAHLYAKLGKDNLDTMRNWNTIEKMLA